MAATILCVDDDRHLCQILEKALTGEGYRVLAAHDGDQAVQRVRESSPDLVLMDLLLPKRDGFGALEEIRKHDTADGRVPVLMMTGCRVTPQYQERAARLGAAGILAKPVPLEVLLERVQREMKETKPGSTGANGKKCPPAPKLRGRQAVSRAQTPLSGSFKDLGFPHLLHHLHGLRATGVLMLATGKKRKAIQVRDGYPIAVMSNLVHECLGNLLVKREVLTQEALKESVQRVRKGEGLQGEILVAMEILNEDEIGDALRDQAEEKLFEIFEWTAGRFEFQIGGRLKHGNELALEDSPANLILRGVRSRLPLDRIDSHLRERAERYVVAGQSSFYRLQEIDLRPEEEELLSQLDGSRKLSELLDAGEEMRRTLFGLLCTEMIDLRSETGAETGARSRDKSEQTHLRLNVAPNENEDRALRTELAALADRLRSQSYFDMLGVGIDADEEAISTAFDGIGKQTHPDRYKRASHAVRQLAAQVNEMLTRAHETLTDPKKRKEYMVERRKGELKAAEQAEGKRALEAEVEFQKGESRIKTRDYEEALRYFGAALEKNPEEGEYYAHYGWCLHLCHPDDASITQEAIEHVKRGMKLARDREKPYLFIGRLYKAMGKNAVAEKMFTRAVQIRPDCVEALRELRLLNMRREKSMGLVRRLLRR